MASVSWITQPPQVIMKQSIFLVLLGCLTVAALLAGVVYLDPLPKLGPAPAEPAEPLGIMGTPRVTPPFIVATEPSLVMVEIEIPDLGYVGGSATLQRLDATGRVITVLGTLKDDGTNGDRISGDKLFALEKTFTEPTPGQVRLQVSVAFQGLLRRVVSQSFDIAVNPFRNPEQVLDALVVDLRSGNIEAALRIISLSAKKADTFRTLDRDRLNRRADAIASRSLVRSERDFRLYVAPFIAPNGEQRRLDIMLSRDEFGDWRISNW